MQVLILSFTFFKICIYSLGNFDPFSDDDSQQNVNLSSLDKIDQSSEINNTQIEKVGPLLELIDSHPHSHDDENSSIIESAKRSLIQPSFDFLDAQLHGGEEHVHQENNQTVKDVADLNDFKRWLDEQNQTNQLNRFLLLQKEINQFRLDDKKDLNDKLNRTIEELKSERQRQKYDL